MTLKVPLLKGDLGGSKVSLKVKDLRLLVYILLAVVTGH
jgi:hypothetical protein